MKRIWIFVKISGIWIWLVSMPATIILLNRFFPDAFFDKPVVIAVAVFTAIVNLAIIINNITKIRHGKDINDVRLFDGLNMTPDEYSSRSNKEKYQYPRINPDMLYDEPQGFCFGQDTRTKKYVCRRIDEEGAILISGGSGTGKSSCYIINYLLWSKGYDQV